MSYFRTVEQLGVDRNVIESELLSSILYLILVTLVFACYVMQVFILFYRNISFLSICIFK